MCRKVCDERRHVDARRWRASVFYGVEACPALSEWRARAELKQTHSGSDIQVEILLK